jgi:hypothetical protein
MSESSTTSWVPHLKNKIKKRDVDMTEASVNSVNKKPQLTHMAEMIPTQEDFRPSESWWNNDDDAPEYEMEEPDLDQAGGSPLEYEMEAIDSNPPNPTAPNPTAPDQQMADPIDPDNPALNTYEMVKARFELNNFKVKNPFIYARIEKGYDPCLHSHVDFRNFYCDLTYWGINKKGDMEKMSFMSAWFDDPKKRVVDRIVMDPTNKSESVYNMWRGFAAEHLPPVDASRVAELIKPLIRHFDDVITRGVEEHTGWIDDYLANIIQRPGSKSHVALSLYGAQGCGKGIIFEFFRMIVLGEHCSSQTSRPENDLFGRFANGAVGCVCLQVDEVKSLHDHSDQLKDLITNPTLNLEKKGKDTIVVDNLVNLILTSNNANALTVSPDDRRFALFHCSSIHKGDAAYFSELGAHLKRPEVARAFYQHLLTRDLSAYPNSFQHSRPITEYYKEAQHNSIPVISRFFSALVNSSYTELEIAGRVMYQQYVHFHTGGNYKCLLTETAFGREIKR